MAKAYTLAFRLVARLLKGFGLTFTPQTNIKHKVQTQWVYLMAVSPMSFVFNEFPNWSGVLDWPVVNSVAVKTSRFNSLQSARKLLMLNLKDLQEECRVDPGSRTYSNAYGIC